MNRVIRLGVYFLLIGLLVSCRQDKPKQPIVIHDTIYRNVILPIRQRHFQVGWYSGHGDGGETVGSNFFNYYGMPPVDSLERWVKCYNHLKNDVIILSIDEMNGADFATFFGKDTSIHTSLDSLKCK